MKFTDLFVRRPVLAIVVNLVILIAGLQAIRIAVGPPVSAQRHLGRDGHDRLRRRQRRPRARVHHDAARARHRQRRRHRLHRVLERAGRLDDHGPPQAQLRHQRGPDAGPGQGRAGAQRPAARGGGADHRPRDGGHRVRGDVHRVLLERPRPEPDHRLPDPRRAAEAVGGLRRAAGRHPRQPHVRHARVAEAREDGRPRHRARGRPDRALREQLPLGDRPDQGLDDLGQPRRQHGPEDRGGVPPARRQGEGRRGRAPGRDRRRGARAPRTTTRTSEVQRPDRHVHGHLGPPDGQLARRHQAGARGDPGHPGAAARPA